MQQIVHHHVLMSMVAQCAIRYVINEKLFYKIFTNNTFYTDD